jgi:hypothetical protein
VRAEITSQEAADERRLSADYYEAAMGALEIIRSEGTNGAPVMSIIAQHAVAHDAPSPHQGDPRARLSGRRAADPCSQRPG